LTFLPLRLRLDGFGIVVFRGFAISRSLWGACETAIVVYRDRRNEKSALRDIKNRQASCVTFFLAPRTRN
jgi:hypothetical protein